MSESLASFQCVPKPREVIGRRLTTLGGILFLIWLFAPIIGSWALYKLVPDFNSDAHVVTVVLAYIALGIALYKLGKHFGGFLKKLDNDKPIILTEEVDLRSMDYDTPIQMAIVAATVFGAKYVILLGATSPPLFGKLGLAIFIATCSANWYPPLRKKVNFWLSFGQKNEALAAARSEGTYCP